MFSNDSSIGGNGFLFFIGLIIVFAILFGGNGFLGGYGGRDAGAVIATDAHYDRLLETMVGVNNNLGNRIDTVAAQQVQYTTEATISQLNNNNQQSRDLITAIAGVNENISALGYKNMEMKITDQAAEIAALRAEKYADGIANASAAQFCDIRNQLTQISKTMLHAPEYIPLGGTAAIGCVQGFPKCGCDCGCGSF